MRESDHGVRMGKALAAVARMHQDTSRLLVDCDQLFPGREPVFGSIATRDLSHSYSAGLWMAKGVYRYWAKPGEDVTGVSALFYDKEDEAALPEPLLVVGRIGYAGSDQDSRTGGGVHPWDMWHAALQWRDDSPVLHKVIEFEKPETHIETMTVIAEPLYSIESLDDVRSMFRACAIRTPDAV